MPVYSVLYDECYLPALGFSLLIRHPHEEESLRWGILAGFGAFATLEDLLDFFGGPVASADVGKGAGDGPDHVVEEAVAFDLED